MAGNKMKEAIRENDRKKLEDTLARAMTAGQMELIYFIRKQSLWHRIQIAWGIIRNKQRNEIKPEEFKITA